jgi:hypothetical protein
MYGLLYMRATMTTIQLQPYTCPDCGAALGNMPLDGSSLKIGGFVVTGVLVGRCDECGRPLTWREHRPARKRRRREKKLAA